MRIAILYGGKSGEHEVSLRSAASVIRHLDHSHKLHLVGITKSGEWHLQPDGILETCLEGDEPLTIRSDGPSVLVVPGHGLRVYGTHGSSDLPLDVVFPVLHGTFGEDGTIQGLLECAEMAYVGADVLGSAIGMDKEVAKRSGSRRGFLSYLSWPYTPETSSISMNSPTACRPSLAGRHLSSLHAAVRVSVPQKSDHPPDSRNALQRHCSATPRYSLNLSSRPGRLNAP